ncbi:uncharacterized protein [Miscanthus floridulus]|uniref:uncharacterized protein n=1 Tax=Miscanthus floridulus TaxID=154761 RepID=UPI00345B30D5
MDSFASAIKNQHSFNKMIESQIAQLAVVVPSFDKAYYYMEPSTGRWIDYTLPEKKSDLGRPVIPIAIGPHIFQEAVCDFRASANIMPKLADQSLCYPKGVLEDAIIRVGKSYVPVDFVVLETGGDERAPIILGRPFLRTTKAIIYADSAKICFTIKDKKVKFSFKNHILQSLRHS